MHKVLFLSYDLKDGGSPQVLSIILSHLDRDVFDPVLVTYSGARVFPIPEGITERILHVEGGGSLLRKLTTNLTAVLRLRRVLRLEKPEITVGMGGMTNWGLILARMLAGGETAVIIGEHGVNAAKYRSDRLTVSTINILSRILYPQADRIVAVSRGVQNYLTEDVKVRQTKKIVHIPNPVDIERIRQLSWEPVDHPWLARKDVPVVLWVGRIEPVKGLGNLIGAFDRVLGETDARLILVGDGSAQNTIRDLVELKGLKEKVDFVGFQSNPYRYMSRCSVFAFPSLSEGFGMVLVEAMACGLPVVSTDCIAGPSEILQNGRCGILVPVGDEGALAQGILKLLTDTELRNRLTSEAFRRVADFEPAKVVASYEQLFHEVCKDKATGEPVGHAR